jgi:hypothetical protein
LQSPGGWHATPRQAIPLQGSDTGGAADFLEVKLEVKLTAGEQR